MKLIELTKGKFTQVDDDDYIYLTTNFNKFQYVENHNTGYAKTTKKINGKLQHLKVHRIILNRFQTIPPGYEIDHIDHDPLNNQKANLRVVTHRDNCNNRGRKRNPICSRCGINFKYNWYSYCLPCYNDYQRERREAHPEMKAKETAYKRTYRARLKAGEVIHR